MTGTPRHDVVEISRHNKELSAGARASQMQRMPEAGVGGFVEGFAQGRVREDGRRDIFEPRAHFQRQCEGR